MLYFISSRNFTPTMKLSKVRHYLVLGMLALLLLSNAAVMAQDHESNVTFENVTLVKHDGWSYRSVAVTPHSSGSGVSVVRPDGAVLQVPSIEIMWILDKDGNDITLKVLPGFKKSKSASHYDEFSLAETSFEDNNKWNPFGFDAPRMFDVMLVAGVGRGSTHGSFYNNIDGGFMYLAELCVATSSSKYLRIGLRSTRSNESTFDYFNESTGDWSSGGTATLDIRQYTFSLGMLSDPRNLSSIRFYAEGGMAIADHVFKVKAGNQSDSDNESRLMVLVKGGALIPIKDQVGLDVGASLDMKFLDDNDNEDIGFLFDIHLGLMVMFGSE